MNTELVRGGSSLLIATTVPAILSPIMGCARRGFSFVTVSLHPQTLALASVVYIATVSFQSVGSWAQGFAFPWHTRPSHPTESSSLRGPHRTPVLRTGISFPVALHGRAFPAAVSFHYRLVDFSLTGTCTPLRCYLHSRTMPLRRSFESGFRL